MIASSSLRTDPARILIVDDERNSARLLELILEAEGFVIELASGGDEALAIVAARPPDLILLDLMMPGMNGYQVTARIKAAPDAQSIPIIMLSILGDHHARTLGLRAGADDFLTKPVDRSELCARVKNLIRLKAYGDYHETYSQMLEGEVLARTADLLERTNTLEQQATAMRHSEERTNFALSAAGTGIWEVELASGKITWSETMARLYGVQPGDSPPTVESFFALIHPDDRAGVREDLEQDVAGGDFHEREFRVIWADGSTHWIAGRAYIVREADGTPVRVLGVGTDVSARKLLETQLRQSQKMDAVGQLAGGIAHDFNNLLTAILGYSNFVIETLADRDERRADMEEVVKAAERATRLTGQLLAFSRKQVMQPTTLDLNEIVAGMRPMLGRLIGEHIDLVQILAWNVGTVRADRGQVEQVLMNLVLNARDAMPDGGRLAIETANVDLDHTCSDTTIVKPGEYVMLSVSDSGTGMSEATKQRLFEPFFSTKEQGKGTGLGLATVHGIVHQSGGHIWVYSEEGLGATFKMFLPRVVSADAAKSVRAPDKTLPAATETVLLVEDDHSVRAFTRTILERAGYRVHDAADPVQAEGLFDQHGAEIAMLVTDVIMPGESGPKLYERLVAKRSDLRVLYVSGYTDDAIVNQGRLHAEIDFLQKPFTATALNRRVREVLER